MSFCINGFVRRLVPALAALILVLTALPVLGQKPAEGSTPSQHASAIWHDPGDIKSKDLLNGPGGEKHRPQLPVKFLKEDKHGQNSKFEVEDSNGTKWKAKLGIEAQPETVATRLLWSIGYFTNENYFVPNLEVKDLPATWSHWKPRPRTWNSVRQVSGKPGQRAAGAGGFHQGSQAGTADL